jgi:hypothetical protein
MTFRHDDFKESSSLPAGNVFAFAIEDGPELVGPTPVAIATQSNPKLPSYGERYIKVGDTPYWEHYGPDSWGESGYYLVFRTADQIRRETEFLLVP